MKQLTAGEVRQILEAMPDEAPIILYLEQDDYRVEVEISNVKLTHMSCYPMTLERGNLSLPIEQEDYGHHVTFTLKER